MPIEFNCQGCQQRLSTPAGSSGQHCQCPGCGTMLTIPAENHPSQTMLADVRHQESGSLKIPCPRCHFVLECAASLLGTKGQCRNCQHIFTIANQTEDDSKASGLDEPTLVFHCPHCRQLFAGQAEMEGRKGKCHACGEVFAIALEPGPSTEAQPAPDALRTSASTTSTSGRSSSSSAVANLAGTAPTATPNSTRKRPEGAPTAKRDPAKPTTQVVVSSSHSTAPIQFSCQHCAGTMEVPASAVGQSTNCPFCGVLLTIPAGSQEALGQAVGPASARFHGGSRAAALAGQQTQQMWTELEDMSGTAQANPYAASAPMPHAAAASQWSARPRRKRLRGLTFANAFELTLDSLFPFCLIAPLLFGMAMIAAYITYITLIAFARSSVRTLELSDPNSLWVLGLGVILGTLIISSFIVTVAYCMTCNTALHAVRGKRVSSRVVFSTGEAYGGMLAIFLGWAVFNFVRKYGVGFLVNEMRLSGDPQTAVIVGALLVLILSLAQVILTFLWGFVPYALLDGQSLSNAMSTSVSICLNHFWTVIAVIICGWILYILVGILSIGLGMIVLAGFSFYMNAAMYHLAED